MFCLFNCQRYIDKNRTAHLKTMFSLGCKRNVHKHDNELVQHIKVIGSSPLQLLALVEFLSYHNISTDIKHTNVPILPGFVPRVLILTF